MITPQEFADQYLDEYRIKDNEMNFRHCPFCGPNTKKDNQFKFYMNMETGAYKCYRANSCGEEGGFLDIKRKYGVEDDYSPDNFDKPKKVKKKKEYKEQTATTEELHSDVVLDYIKRRGISAETAKKHNVKESVDYEGNPCLAFEYYENGKRVLIKYRNLKKGKDKSYWQAGGGKPVLYGIDNIDTDKTLVIVEGEFDKLAINEAGEQNVVSVPFGSNNMQWIEENFDILEQIDSFIIWSDNDKAGQKMQKEILKRLGRNRCFIAEGEYIDANVEYYKRGAEGVIEILNNAKPVPVQRLIDFKDIEEFDPSEIETVRSNIPLINKYLGGYMMGAVTIWTGSNSSGKSTLINQEVLQAIDDGFGTALLTGELPNWLARYWLELQAAGPAHIDPKYDEIREKQVYYVNKEAKLKIRDWFSNNMLRLYDSMESLKVDDIKETFEEAAKRYGIKNFVVDNLMIVNYNASYQEKYNKQSQFVAAMKEFAKNYDVHVHIVAHPRKPKGEVITKEDVAGLYEITNLVDNVIGIHRVTDKNRKALGIDDDTENILEIFKGRIYGMQDIRIKLGFNEDCKRFAQRDVNDFRKKYGWEE